MALTLDDLFASPDHYLHSFDGEAAIFVPMDRAAYARSIFLDGRISPAGDGSMRLPLATMAGRVPAPLPTAWIMHVAHCGSTLLARALDAIGDNLVLREPQALRQLALMQGAALVPLTAALLSKRYLSSLPTVIKANVPVNFILGRIAALDPAARMLFLHLPLRDYLLAILRSEGHRSWLRRVTAQLAPFLGELSAANDAERAAALWLAQMEIYAAAATLPNARSLDAEVFFARPHDILALAAGHLGVDFTNAAIDLAVAGPLFATYSKNPGVAFDNAARVARRAATEVGMRAELDRAAQWLDAHQKRADAASAGVAAIALG
jgi:hypothetical protein